MSAFIVPRDTPGVEVGKKEKTMGQRASDTRGITFTDVVVPEANRVGGEGRGWFLAMKAFEHTRPVVAAAGVGVARAAMEHAIRYANERRAFGHPIAQQQAIAFMIAEMAYEVDAMRLMSLKAASTVEAGLDARRESYLAKLYAGDMTMKVTDFGVQVLGGHGYVRDHPVERFYRNGRGIAILEGMTTV